MCEHLERRKEGGGKLVHRNDISEREDYRESWRQRLRTVNKVSVMTMICRRTDKESPIGISFLSSPNQISL